MKLFWLYQLPMTFLAGIGLAVAYGWLTRGGIVTLSIWNLL